MQALFICDLHAHLAKTEIIGFLGGTWNAERREIVVRAAFPCRALPIESDAKVNVELDPQSDIEVLFLMSCIIHCRMLYFVS